MFLYEKVALRLLQGQGRLAVVPALGWVAALWLSAFLPGCGGDGDGRETWHIECGRFGGEWSLQGELGGNAIDGAELARVKLDVEWLAPDVEDRNVRLASPREISAIEVGRPRGGGNLVVGGGEYAFVLWPYGVKGSGRDIGLGASLLVFESQLPFVPAGGFGDAIEIAMTAAEDPSDDLLHLLLGVDGSGFGDYLTYVRISGPPSDAMRLSRLASSD